MESQIIAWTDLFYGMLIAPGETLKVLANASTYRPSLPNVIGACIVVSLCSLVESFAQGVRNPNLPLPLMISSSFFNDLLIWLLLSLFLAWLSSCLANRWNFWTATIVVGWTFVPLIFTAPIAACAASQKTYWDLFLSLPIFWFLILEWLAFDALLNLGKARTLGVIFLTPPLLCFAATFWVILWFMIAVGIQP